MASPRNHLEDEPQALPANLKAEPDGVPRVWVDPASAAQRGGNGRGTPVRPQQSRALVAAVGLVQAQVLQSALIKPPRVSHQRALKERQHLGVGC